jgi:hypothetical protein
MDKIVCWKDLKKKENCQLSDSLLLDNKMLSDDNFKEMVAIVQQQKMF